MSGSIDGGGVLLDEEALLVVDMQCCTSTTGVFI